MQLNKTSFPDLYIVEPRVFEDDRGFFYESYSKKSFDNQGIPYDFVQDNHSKSSFGVLRGLHFQNPPFAQTKLVRVTKGKVLDVVVDIRNGSPTFLKHFAIELSEQNKLQLLIPQGFAHGFVVLSEEVEFLYKCDQFYDKASEGGLLYNDPMLQIDWKLREEEIILSEKDKVYPVLNDTTIFNFPFEKFTNTIK